MDIRIANHPSEQPWDSILFLPNNPEAFWALKGKREMRKGEKRRDRIGGEEREKRGGVVDGEGEVGKDRAKRKEKGRKEEGREWEREEGKNIGKKKREGERDRREGLR